MKAVTARIRGRTSDEEARLRKTMEKTQRHRDTKAQRRCVVKNDAAPLCFCVSVSLCFLYMAGTESSTLTLAVTGLLLIGPFPEGCEFRRSSNRLLFGRRHQ